MGQTRIFESNHDGTHIPELIPLKADMFWFNFYVKIVSKGHACQSRGNKGFEWQITRKNLNYFR